jgi:hypothetical protein
VAGAPAPLLGLERADWLRLGEIGGLLAVALLILLFGVRPLLRRLSPVPARPRPLPDPAS